MRTCCCKDAYAALQALNSHWLDYGESGLVLAAASLLGAFTNSPLLRRGSSAYAWSLPGIAMRAALYNRAIAAATG